MIIDFGKATIVKKVSPTAPLSIFIADEESEPRILYSPNSTESLTDVLLSAGVGYNESTGEIYNMTKKPLMMMFVTGDLVLDPETLEPLVLSYDPSGLDLRYARAEGYYAVSENTETGELALQFVDDNYVIEHNYVLPGFHYTLLPAVTLTVGNDLLMLVNSKKTNIGLQIEHNGISFDNVGPADSVVEVSPTKSNVCLAPIKNILNRTEAKYTDYINFEGKFAVIINDEIVPYYFLAKDLPKFFNSKSDWGIQFTNKIMCTPNNLVAAAIADIPAGEWVMNYSFNDGAMYQYAVTLETGSIDIEVLEAMYRSIWESQTEGGVLAYGGGIGNFFMHGYTLSGSRGTALDTPILFSLHKSTELGVNDLFDAFYSAFETDRLDVQSCGYEMYYGE